MNNMKHTEKFRFFTLKNPQIECEIVSKYETGAFTNSNAFTNYDAEDDFKESEEGAVEQQVEKLLDEAKSMEEFCVYLADFLYERTAGEEIKIQMITDERYFSLEYNPAVMTEEENDRLEKIWFNVASDDAKWRLFCMLVNTFLVEEVEYSSWLDY